jgi:hypothetical protein
MLPDAERPPTIPHARLARAGSCALALLLAVACTVAERREYAAIAPVAASDSMRVPAPGFDDLVGLRGADADVEVRVLDSRGRVALAGFVLPLVPLPPANFGGPSPWLHVTVHPRAGAPALAFDPAAIVLEMPDGRRLAPLLLAEPTAPDECHFGRFIVGPDSLARAGSPPREFDAVRFEGARCFQVAFALPAKAAPSYLLHIPWPETVRAAAAPDSSAAAPRVWVVCVRPRASWEAILAPLEPLTLFHGPSWTYLKTKGRADFRSCPAAE